jgi:LuxR family maltose regulon positive regulatory protein
MPGDTRRGDRHVNDEQFPDDASAPAGRLLPIIQGKLRAPQSSEALVERPRLAELIASLLGDHSPLVVYGTAGSGKTTAVAQALGRVGLPAAWLTVDDTDADPYRLLAYLEAAFAAQIPAAAGLVTRALRQGVPHAEAAGLLAEATAAAPVLVVLDELERIATADSALGIVSALIRHAPQSLRIVLVSRRELALDLGTRGALSLAAALHDDDLAFSTEEAAAALIARGQGETDPEAAVAAHGGWVAGVLFEGSRSSARLVGTGGESNAFHGYLATHVLPELDPHEREFLIATSPLPEVSALRAEALGLPGAGGPLSTLRAKHLPLAWRADGKTLRCHPRFRDYLLVLLERLPAAEVSRIHRACGECFAQEGLHIEAVEEFLLAGAFEPALAAAKVALGLVVERLEYAVAERWLAVLRPLAPPDDDALTQAELMLAIVRERHGVGAAIADARLCIAHQRLEAQESNWTLAMMAWCYWFAGRVGSAECLLARARDESDLAGIRAVLSLADPGAHAPAELTGLREDALILYGRYVRGSLRDLVEPPASRWAAAVSAPWRVGALRALGRTQEALDLCEAARAAGSTSLWLEAVIEPELLIERGRADEARASLERGQKRIHEHGGLVLDVCNRIVSAKLELRLTRQFERAAELLLALEGRDGLAAYPFLSEQVATWSGMAMLMRGQPAAAARRLRPAVRSMRASGRIMELPTAAVLLAEAEWSLGHTGAAHRAAELALGAAARQGSNHILMQALGDFPAVATRQIESEPLADSPWHELGRAIMATSGPVTAAAEAHIHLAEFGHPRIDVNGAEARPRIKKSYELLAYLGDREPHEAERDELLDALFGGRADESARSYLRQAVHRLREILPDGAVLAFEGSRLRLGGDIALVCERVHAEEVLARAARQLGRDRLELLLEALAVLDRGEYLAGVDSAWVDDRRQQLAAVIAQARHDAAQLLFAEEDYAGAKRLAQAVVHADPYREGAWRLLMRIAHATGDEDGVIAVYRLCEHALRGIGTVPSTTTGSLLTTLRR